MSNEKIFNKIKKCLELSKSSNEHESAAALRQAHALMKKHNIELSDVEQSKIDVAEMEGKYQQPPLWKTNLYLTVARAFNCSFFTRGGRPVYAGPSSSPQIALYATEVLLRQLELNKKQYMEEIKSKYELSRSESIRLGKGFCEGWVQGCYSVVEKFADPVSDEQHEKNAGRVSDYFDHKITESKTKQKSALDDDLGLMAGRKGYGQGQKAQIHTGMGADGKPAMLEAEA